MNGALSLALALLVVVAVLAATVAPRVRLAWRRRRVRHLQSARPCGYADPGVRPPAVVPPVLELRARDAGLGSPPESPAHRARRLGVDELSFDESWKDLKDLTQR